MTIADSHPEDGLPPAQNLESPITSTGHSEGEAINSTIEVVAPSVSAWGQADTNESPFKNGMVNTNDGMMTLYNHNTDAQSQARWSEFQDPVAEEKRLKELGKTFAIIHKQSKVEKDGLVSWVTTSLEAQSPRLRKSLDTIFGDYPSWYPDGRPYAVTPPFQPYVHRWAAFLEACRQEHPDEKTTTELQLLRQELAPRIDGSLSALDKVKKTGAVSFDDLWLLWNPGSLMISSKPGPTRVFKLAQAVFTPGKAKEPGYYSLTLAFVEWNGTDCGYKSSCEQIYEYKGSISVTKLPVYPVEFADQWKETEKRLIERGRKYESLRGYHIKACEGKKITLEMDPFQRSMVEVEKPVSGRVIIDAHAYYKVQNRMAPDLIPLIDGRRSLLSLYHSLPKGELDTDRETFYDYEKAPRQNSPDSSNPKPGPDSDAPNVASPAAIPNPVIPSGMASAANRFVAPNRPRRAVHPASSLRRAGPRGPVGLNNIKFEQNSERKENMPPLEDLECIIASPRVKGFHLSVKEWCEFDVDDIQDVKWDDSPYDNLVLPEGEKELVFAFADRPRFSKQGFDDFIAHKGEGIIILLYGPPGVGKTLTAEAVFLRRLEYYRGLMFLTTNRNTAIDSAFRSRIDLVLPYVDLDEANRRKVWANFVLKLGPGIASISDADLDELAKTPLNGREIKNSIKTALVLANADKPLRLRHLKVVLNIRKRAALLDHHD